MTDLAEPTEDGYYWVLWAADPDDDEPPESDIFQRYNGRWFCDSWTGGSRDWADFSWGSDDKPRITSIEPVVPSSWSRTPAQALAALQESEQRAREGIAEAYVVVGKYLCRKCGQHYEVRSDSENYCQRCGPPVPAHPSGPEGGGK